MGSRYPTPVRMAACERMLAGECVEELAAEIEARGCLSLEVPGAHRCGVEARPTKLGPQRTRTGPLEDQGLRG